jgi:hypothetical protein
MSTPIDEFRATVFGPHLKKAWAVRLLQTLQFVTAHPEYCLEIGLIPLDSCSFLVNSNVLACFLGLKRNSLNHNFQQHGFILDITADSAEELQTHAPELVCKARNWSKRVFKYGLFNAQCTRQQVAVASIYAKNARKHNPRTEEDLPLLEYHEFADTESYDDWSDFACE